MSLLDKIDPFRITKKDMSVLREGDSARVQHKKKFGVVRDYTLNHTIKLSWEKSGNNLKPFRLQIGDKSFIISWKDLKDLDSEGYFRRETKQSRRSLKHYDGHKLVLDVALNDDAERDMIFRLSGDGFEIYSDWYEWLRIGRFI